MLKHTPSRRSERLVWIIPLMLLPLLAGCDRHSVDGAFVLTQVPLGDPQAGDARDLLDQRYPAGSRVVLVTPPFEARGVRVLSKGLFAAGDGVVCPAGKRVFFAGKAEASGAWQIYESNLRSGRPKRITSMAGGAMSPVRVAYGELVFSSPVPLIAKSAPSQSAPALYVQAAKGQPRRLTFSSAGALEPTALEDGRILFVSPRSARESGECDKQQPAFGLFTISTDGTEVTSYALDRDGPPLVSRPRELADGRVAFLTADDTAPHAWQVQAVSSARPFASRVPLLEFASGRFFSVESQSDGTLLVCLAALELKSGSAAVYQVASSDSRLGEPLFDDPQWDDIEATPLHGRMQPMGHVSSMKANTTTGTLLCLDAHFTRPTPGQAALPKATRVRIWSERQPGETYLLGEIPLQADGSFLAEVPADMPLGLETLDAEGRVLKRLPPSIWVRPGENRGCLGCHEPYNHSPRNVRPLAVSIPPVVLSAQPQTSSPAKP